MAHCVFGCVPNTGIVFYWSVPLPSVCPGGLVKQATQCILYLSG